MRRIRMTGFVAILFVGALTSCEKSAIAPQSEAPQQGPRLSQMNLVAADRDTLFGPMRFFRMEGKPGQQTVAFAGDDFSSFEPPFVLHLRNGNTDGSRRVSSARIRLDGALVFGPEDFSQQVASLDTEVSLRGASTLTVKNAGAPGSFLEIWIEGTRVADEVQARIGPDGGTIELEGLANLEFPAGFFGTSRLVQVSRVEDEAAMGRFEEFAFLYRVATHTSYQLRVLAGDTQPEAGTFEIILNVPDDLNIPPDHNPEVFAQVYQEGGQEVLDNFHLFPSSYNPETRTLTATLPAYVLTGARREDGLFEAIFMIAATPGGGNTANLRTLQQSTGDPDECKAAFIICPLGIGCEVTSEFGVRVHPITGQRAVHLGVDLRAPNGTSVLAAADGTIEKVDPITDPPDGFGRYIVLRHNDGSATLYGHLQEAKVEDGQKVEAGELIALSDNAGLSDGPHLHVTYVPNGSIYANKNAIDPFPCIGGNAEGSITVRDNGNLADDAFAVHLDGVHVGTTDIGAANTFAVNNLIPGDHSLRVTGVVVPDNAGTFEVILSDGITFADGSVRRSGVVELNASATFSITVPTSSTQTLTAQAVSLSELMRPNAVIEGNQ